MTTVFSNRPGSDQDAYIAAVLGLVGERDPVEVLAATPRELRRVLEPVPEEELRRPEAPGKWSLLQVAAHLADSEVAYAWRLRLILAQDRPPLTGYDQDAWAERLGYAQADLGESLALFEALRASNLRLLRRLAPEDWDRVAVHAERGEESVRHMAKLYAGHDVLHLRQIERILGGR
jgi:uncharacterized damage-inducible protein DinB